jgi:hypothetical protein
MTSAYHVPYQIVPSSKGLVQAFFIVPTEWADSLTQYPILCRGSLFTLQVYKESTRLDPRRSSSPARKRSRLVTVYESPYPKETAMEIAQRLSNRWQDMDMTQEKAHSIAAVFGF